LSDDLISVLLPVWKVKSDYLSKSIKSILEQTYTNLELITIYRQNEEDKDKELEGILDENQDDHRFKKIVTKVKGLSNSLNLGLKNSTGQFIARMDADDISEKNRFDEQINFLKETKSDLVGSWANSISENDKIIGTIKPPTEHKEIRRKIMFHNPFLHPSIFFKKDIIKKVGNYNPKFNGAEDYDFYFRIMALNYKVSNIPKFLINLRETNNSIMRGSGWFHNRWINYKVKENAVKNLGFTKAEDIFHFSLTPMTFLVTPRTAFYLKKKIGHNKEI
jgi:glycosyltransferase involved in cell wall biosynthesis